MYKLYYMPGACSLAVHAVLNELNQAVELENVRVAPGQNRSAEFLKDNPRGQVPTLVDDGFVIREGGAILAYLLDKHGSDLLPKSGFERAAALEWLMFANSTLHPTYSRVFHALFQVKDKILQEGIIKPAAERINQLWAEVDAKLGETKFIAGDKPTAGDILLAVIANWGIEAFPFEVKRGENLQRMLKDIISRPAFKKALEAEGASYKAI